jgi:diguanylate cyclase (GGDEF)-like protein
VSPHIGFARSAFGSRLPTAEIRLRVGVYGLTAILAIVAIALYGLIDPHALHPGTPTLTWWMLAALFGVTETFVVHLSVGRETHTFSLNECPLVLGLFLATPGDLLLGQLVGAGLALAVVRRQAPRKLAFNLASFAVSTAAGIAAFTLIADPADPLGPRGWIAAYVAAVLADVVSSTTVEAVISVSTGQRPNWSRLVGSTELYTIANASLGLVAVLLLTFRPETAWLAGLLTVAIYGAYRASERERQKHYRLLSLQEATRDVQEALSAEVVTRRLLERAREMFGAEMAELLALPTGDASASRTRVDGIANVEHEPSVRLDPTEGVWARVASEGQGIRVATATAPERLRDHLLAEDIRNLMAAPVRGGSGVVAILMVMNREGNVGGWRDEDLMLLETLGNHAGIALRNGELVEGLASRAAENEFQAHHDALTGLPNRVQFQVLVDLLLKGRKPPVALLTMDLDDFKEINDTLGHENGDRILRDLADRLRTVLIEGEAVARLAGDEFAMIITGEDPVAAAHAAAERVQHILEAPFAVDELMLNVSASMGLAIVGVDGDDASTLLRRADVAMYLAKAGHTPYELYAAERDEYSPARLALAGELRHALETHELQVWFQPKTDMASGRIMGAEALARWIHPIRGLIMPDDFIPIIEQTSLLRPMTLHVLEVSIGRCASWRRAGLELGVAVNLSVRNLLDLQLPKDILRLLADADLPSTALTLEITESAMMADPTRAEIVLGELRLAGVRISIDDFGTGHASLAYLKRLPVSELKIDRAFIMGLDTDEQDRSIVRSTIDLAHDLGLTTVAEGVESQWVWDWLVARGCDVAQGYLKGKATPTGAFEELVRRNFQEVGSLRLASVTLLPTRSPRAARTTHARPASRAPRVVATSESPRLEGWDQALPPAANT